MARSGRFGIGPGGFLGELSQSSGDGHAPGESGREWTAFDERTDVDLLVVRHAIAEDREAFAASGRDDAQRPLTDTGRRKFEKAARGLRKLVASIDVLATSTLVRAMQTGEILEAAYGIRSAARLAELAPDADPSALIPWLRRNRARSLVAVVGHEPHLSLLVGHLLVGTRAGFVALKKGGACLLGLGTTPQAERAELRWLLTAAQLRRIR